MHPPFSAGKGGEVGPPIKFSKRGGGGGLTGPHIFKGGCLERGGDFFSGGRGCNFHIKIIEI